MKRELWRPVVGFEGLYEISSLGRLKNLDWNNTGKAKIIQFSKVQSTGYVCTTLKKDGKRFGVRVHRLVAEAFIPNPENKPFIDHINTIRNDNRVENLRWATPKENMNNSLTQQHLRRPRKKKNNGSVQNQFIFSYS